MVDLPEAERPVNHNVKPFWWRREQRSGWVTDEACHVILLAERYIRGRWGRGEERGIGKIGIGAPTWPFVD